MAANVDQVDFALREPQEHNEALVMRDTDRIQPRETAMQGMEPQMWRVRIGGEIPEHTGEPLTERRMRTDEPCRSAFEAWRWS